MRLLSCLSVLALCLATASTVQAQQVYQWKDKNGVTHYSDSPPPNQQAAQNRRINQYGAAATDAPQPAGKPVENPQCTTARANLQAAQAQLDIARKALADTELRAPISGQVAVRLVQDGERVPVDARVLEIVDSRALEIEAALPPADALQLRIGQPADWSVDGPVP